jgi:hypothetical protein
MVYYALQGFRDTNRKPDRSITNWEDLSLLGFRIWMTFACLGSWDKFSRQYMVVYGQLKLLACGWQMIKDSVEG